MGEPPVVEPIDPFQGRELDGFEAAPWSTPVDQLGLVETVDGFGERIVVGISNTADGRLHASLTVDWPFLEGRFGEVYTDDPATRRCRPD